MSKYSKLDGFLTDACFFFISESNVIFQEYIQRGYPTDQNDYIMTHGDAYDAENPLLRLDGEHSMWEPVLYELDKEEVARVEPVEDRQARFRRRNVDVYGDFSSSALRLRRQGSTGQSTLFVRVFDLVLRNRDY